MTDLQASMHIFSLNDILKLALVGFFSGLASGTFMGFWFCLVWIDAEQKKMTDSRPPLADFMESKK